MKPAFKYTWTVLNAAALIYCVICICYSIIYFKGMSHEEGWGVVLMLAVFLFGLTAFVVDLLLQFFVRNKPMLLKISIIAMLAYVILFFILFFRW